MLSHYVPYKKAEALLRLFLLLKQDLNLRPSD